MIQLSCPVSERAILSSLFHHAGKAYHEIEDIILDANCFTIDSNQFIYKAIEKIIKDDDLARILRGTLFVGSSCTFA